MRDPTNKLNFLSPSRLESHLFSYYKDYTLYNEMLHSEGVMVVQRLEDVALPAALSRAVKSR